MIINAHWSSSKAPIILFILNTQMPNFTDIPPVGAELFRADERTGMTKLTVAFCSFTKAPENVYYTRLVLCIR
jgi:hypothetical protein